MSTQTVTASYPWKRVARTAVQVVLSCAAVLAVIEAAAPGILAQLTDVLPGSWIAWLTSGVAFLTAVSAALARIMALPAVETGLSYLGLSSTPATATVDPSVNLDITTTDIATDTATSETTTADAATTSA